MPDVGPGFRLEGDDGADVEVGAALRAAILADPRAALRSSDVEQVEIGIVGDAVPDRAAAAEFPPFPGPGLGRGFHGFVLERLGGIAGNGVEAPDELSGFRVVRGNEAARGVFTAGIADDDFSSGDDGSAGDAVVGAHVSGLHGPDFLAGFCVESDELGLEGADVNLAVVERHAAIGRAAANARAGADLIGLAHGPCGEILAAESSGPSARFPCRSSRRARRRCSTARCRTGFRPRRWESSPRFRTCH